MYHTCITAEVKGKGKAVPSRQIHIECQSKHNYIYVIYKLLVYVQTSQPTTCFGLFQLGNLQVGHEVQRNYKIMYYYH